MLDEALDDDVQPRDVETGESEQAIEQDAKVNRREQNSNRRALAVLRALTVSRRQAIFRFVRDEPRSVKAICEHFDMSQQAVWQHLQILTKVRLVAVQRDGRRCRYVLDTRGLEVLERFVGELWPFAASG